MNAAAIAAATFDNANNDNHARKQNSKHINFLLQNTRLSIITQIIVCIAHIEI